MRPTHQAAGRAPKPSTSPSYGRPPTSSAIPSSGSSHQLAKQCGDAGRYVHWGATTQDIMDTATVLQIRGGPGARRGDLAAIDAALAARSPGASRHGDGGPHASAARAAGDLRLQGCRLAQHGSAPSPAAGGDRAARARRPVRRRGRYAGFARRQGPCRARCADGELGLGRPPMPWHVARDGLAEAVAFLA